MVCEKPDSKAVGCSLAQLVMRFQPFGELEASCANFFATGRKKSPTQSLAYQNPLGFRPVCPLHSQGSGLARLGRRPD